MWPGLCRLRAAVMRGAVAIIFFHDSVKAAEETPWLEYSAAPECPGKPEIVAKLRTWLGDAFEPQKPLAARARASFDGSTWVVEVELSYGDAHGTRKVAVETCSEAADFVAVTIALSIEPGFQTELEQAAAPAPQEPEADDEAAQRQEEAPVRPRAALSSTALSSTEPSSPTIKRKARKNPFVFETGVGALLSASPFPGIRPGAAVHGFAARGSWYFGLEGTAVFPFEYQVARAENPVNFFQWLAHPRVCPSWGRDWRILGCVGAELGSVRGKEVVLSDARPAEGAWSFWGAATLGAQLRGALVGPVGFNLGGDFILPFAAPSFELAGENDVEVYRPGAGLRGFAGIFLRL